MPLIKISHWTDMFGAGRLEQEEQKVLINETIRTPPSDFIDVTDPFDLSAMYLADSIPRQSGALNDKCLELENSNFKYIRQLGCRHVFLLAGSRHHLIGGKKAGPLGLESGLSEATGGTCIAESVRR